MHKGVQQAISGAYSSRLPDAWIESGKPGRRRARPAFDAVPCCALHETRGSHTTMTMATMLLALAAAATALPENHPTCLAACAGLSRASRRRPAPWSSGTSAAPAPAAPASAGASRPRPRPTTRCSTRRCSIRRRSRGGAGRGRRRRRRRRAGGVEPHGHVRPPRGRRGRRRGRRQEAPGGPRRRARRRGCLAAVAVAVAVLLGQGVLEYEYEFLFDAGAMGKFEGLVPKAVPTRSSPSSSRGRITSAPAARPSSRRPGDLAPRRVLALPQERARVRGLRARRPPGPRGVPAQGPGPAGQVVAGQSDGGVVPLRHGELGHQGRPAAQRPGLLRRAAARRHSRFTGGRARVAVADLGPRRVPARRAFTEKRPRAAAYCCGRGPARRKSRGDGRRRRRPRAALRPAEVGDDVPPRAHSTYNSHGRRRGDLVRAGPTGGEFQGAERGECGPRGGRRRCAPPARNLLC